MEAIRGSNIRERFTQETCDLVFTFPDFLLSSLHVARMVAQVYQVSGSA